MILLNGRPIQRLSKGVGWFSGTCLLRTRGMYVELGDNFCPSCVTITSSSRSPPADHLRLTVTSSIASSRRKMTFPRLLTLAIIPHVCPYVFHFTRANVGDSVIMGISLRFGWHGGNYRTYTYRYTASLFRHQGAGPQDWRVLFPPRGHGSNTRWTKCRSPIHSSSYLNVVVPVFYYARR